MVILTQMKVNLQINLMFMKFFMYFNILHVNIKLIANSFHL